MEDYGNILRVTRLIKGFSQEQIAEKVGLSRSAVSRLENNKLELKVADAVRWGQVTQTTEVIAAMICGIDTASIIQSVTMLIGGWIIWI
ncbi:helix-turn-helix transcriptional regulator [Lederbergia lenta]|uniref:helix-turn-helix transcriptional regulator n=1 Tax=Lederbergia lenta TaxID=1467 RepID=UPI002040E4EA|nr:helix-turn-helix transcriptional regulator [Lederbergia lenta]MCM3111647.1 helix-turn-helix domain-containing protein [Lederbergia lenta]